jgi:hypothetical protein
MNARSSGLVMAGVLAKVKGLAVDLVEQHFGEVCSADGCRHQMP